MQFGYVNQTSNDFVVKRGQYQLIEAKWRIPASVHWTIVGSDNNLSPVRHQAIIWTKAGLLWIGSLQTNFSEILIKIRFWFKKMHIENVVCKMAVILSHLNVLIRNKTQSMRIFHGKYTIQ